MRRCLNEVTQRWSNMSLLLKVNYFGRSPKRSESFTILAKPNLRIALHIHHAPLDSGKAQRRSFIQLIRPPRSKNCTCRGDIL